MYRIGKVRDGEGVFVSLVTVLTDELQRNMSYKFLGKFLLSFSPSLG
jgi:hypothetical protein